jgi:hypothetical protein
MRIFGQLLLVDKQKVPYLYKAKEKNSSFSSPPELFKEFRLSIFRPFCSFRHCLVALRKCSSTLACCSVLRTRCSRHIVILAPYCISSCLFFLIYLRFMSKLQYLRVFIGYFIFQNNLLY